MTINLQSNSNLQPAPIYVSPIVTFLINNLNNGDILEYFYLIIKSCRSTTDFSRYKAKFIPPSHEEGQLLNLIEVFYNSATGNMDNERGSLLEYVIDEILSRQFASHTRHNAAVLELLDTQGANIATIHPNNIDFFLEEPSINDTKCFESKVTVEQNSSQLTSFNSFAQVLNAHGVTCPIKVVHSVTDTFAKLYPRWYPHLYFINPTDLKNGNI
jgi:hypothetical protein